MAIVDQFGRPIDSAALTEPQTARLSSLRQEFAGHPSRGLTPPRLARILESAEQGDLMAQCELFEDMEEKDAHIFAEISKRKRALQTIPWDILPPRDATAAEKKDADYLKEALGDLPDFEDVLFDALDAIGKGYSCQEIEWQRLGRDWLPKRIDHRPPAWFKVPQIDQNEIRLRDNSVDGAQLQPFGWIVHRHKAKSGYIARAGLHRVLAWPYLFKVYAVRDLAELLEIYGLPLRLGTYPSGAGDREKATLLQAVVAIGHNAAGIIPEGMGIEFKEASKGTHDPFDAMIAWAERSQSKAILGGTLTSQADGKSSTNALGNVHNEVRHDLRDSDARQLAGTLTQFLLYPILALNRGGVQDARRAPRLVFDVQEPEDLKLYSSALPALAKAGMQIPVAYVHEKLRIPMPKEGEAVLVGAVSAPEDPAPAAARAALRARADRDVADDFAEQLDERAREAIDALLAPVRGLVMSATSIEDLRAGLLDLYPGMSTEAFARVLEQSLLAADLAGRFEISDGG